MNTPSIGDDWQSIAALAVVVVTLLVFAVVRARKGGHSCGSCGCEMKDHLKK